MTNAAKDVLSGPCPIGRAAGVLGDKWMLLIMRNALIGETRFDQFRGSLGIADNILSNRLVRLVGWKLLVKVPYTEGNRTRQEYALTPAGVALRPVFLALGVWGHEYVNPDEPTSAVLAVHIACGQVSRDAEFCDTCQTPFGEGEVAWVMPWLSESPVPLATAVTVAQPS